jgi:hypothetical protein
LGFILGGIIGDIFFSNSENAMGATVSLSIIIAPILSSLLLKLRIKKLSRKHKLYIDAMDRKLKHDKST